MLKIVLDGTDEEIMDFYKKFLMDCKRFCDDDIDFKYYMHESGIKFRVGFLKNVLLRYQ